MRRANGHIRVLHSVGPGDLAGTQRALATYLEAADHDRFEHHVICRSDGGLVECLRRLDLRVTVVPARAYWHPAPAAKLARTLRGGGFQLFHMNPSRVEGIIAHLLGVPVVCRRNVGFDPFWARWRQDGPLARLLNAPIDRFIVPAAFLVGEYERRGVGRARVRVVRNGVSITAPAAAEIRRARREMGDGRAPLVVSAGRLVGLKGHATLLRAVAALRRRRVNVRAAIVGDGEERAGLERLAGDLGLRGRVRFVGWKPQVAPYLAAADLYVQPSLSEVLPNAVLEAMALGGCVVASDIGGMRDAITPGANGELIAPGDAEALAAALGALLANPERRGRLGAAARATIARDFTVAEMVRRTEAVYEELIEVTT
jgi:glycosyltransferase involved in cell wall biosynthesis